MSTTKDAAIAAQQPATTLAEIVAQRAGDDKVGLCFDDRSWTWAEVVQEGCARASLLESIGRPAGRQVHVGLLLENVPDFVFWTAGAALSGAVLVGINSSRTPAEIAQDVSHADIDVIVTESRLHHLLSETDTSPLRAPVLDIDTKQYADLLAPHADAGLPRAAPSPEDIAFLLYSSGSTGRPKAVVVGQGRMARLAPALVDRIELTRESVTYLCMPLFHGNSLMMNLVAAMATGARVGMVRKFSASRFAADIHRFGATYVNYVGRALSYVLRHPGDPRDADSTLDLAFGTEASEADVRNFGARFGCRVNEGYGLSEGVFRINRGPDTPPGSLGLPAANADVRVLDESTGQECPRARFDATGRLTDPAAVGQMVAVGLAHTFEGYYKNPDAMAERVRGEDFWSGDLAYRDEQGFFYFAGRSSDWLRVDSENFAAAQVERILQRHPAVAAAPVYAVPDPVTGDRVMCGIELRAGHTFDPREFGAFLDAQADLGAKWWPTFVRVVEAVPLTGSNKVDKAPLRRDAWECGDTVYVRRGRTAEYVVLTPSDRERLAEEFREHGRAAHLPAPV